MKFRSVSSPTAITTAIREFARQLQAEPPVFIRVKPCRRATVLNCYLNVQERVRQQGGSLIYGWAIWEQPQFLLEAHFHAVWKSTEGLLVDITPPQDSEPKILFCADRNRTWIGKRVPHRRYALANNRRAIGAVKALDKLGELAAEYEDSRTIAESEIWSAIYSSGLTRQEGEFLLKSTMVIPDDYVIQRGL